MLFFEDEDTTTLDITGLEKILKALKGPLPIAKVGILAGGVRSSQGQEKVKAEGSFGKASMSKAPHKGDYTNNATLGALHEFGGGKMPQRSFLRQPITEKIQGELEKSGAFDEEAIKEIVRTGSLLEWVKKLGIIAEKIVGEAFATGGFGKWAKWKNPNYKNNTGQILVDTTQLRDSITSEVTNASS